MNREVLVKTLIAHQRVSAQYCSCGWGRLGLSHADHIADEIEKALETDIYSPGWEERDLEDLIQIIWRNAMPGYEPIRPDHPDWAFFHEGALGVMHMSKET